MSEYKLTAEDKAIAFELAESAIQTMWENVPISEYLVEALEEEARESDEGSAFKILQEESEKGSSDRFEAIIENALDCIGFSAKSTDDQAEEEYQRQLREEFKGPHYNYMDFDELVAHLAKNILAGDAIEACGSIENFDRFQDDERLTPELEKLGNIVASGWARVQNPPDADWQEKALAYIKESDVFSKKAKKGGAANA
jgi:hypothetical protein